MEATTSLRRTEIVDLLNSSEVNQEVCIKGWVRHFRSNRFLILNDGSTINTIQVVVDTDNTNEDIIKKLTVGASVSIIGTLVESQGKGQNREVQGKEIEILGELHYQFNLPDKQKAGMISAIVQMPSNEINPQAEISAQKQLQDELEFILLDKLSQEYWLVES